MTFVMLNDRLKTAFEDILDIEVGEVVFNYSNSQSPALVNRYHHNLRGAWIPAVAAKDWWDKDWDEVDRLYFRSDTPQVGAIFIGRGGKYDYNYGHMGIITEVHEDGQSFVTLEQNGGLTPGVSKYVRNMDNILGFLIPRIEISPKAEKMSTTPKELTDKDFYAMTRRALSDYKKGLATPWRLVNIIEEFLRRAEKE